MSTLKELGYKFNGNGELRVIETGEPFKFTTQKAYEELGEAVTLEVYRLLQKRCGLLRIPLKYKCDDEEYSEHSFIFVSPGYDKKKTLLVLVHGMGVVRAGQWARRLIINENLDWGTQIPYIRRAITNGWGVLVMNTNENKGIGPDGRPFVYDYSATSKEHAESVWRMFVSKSQNEKIFIVAHSRGGLDVSHVMARHEDKRVKVICLTDSSFQFPPNCERKQYPFVINWTVHDSANFVTKQGLHTRGRVLNLYAGTTVHERSSHRAIDSVFHVLECDPNDENIQEVLVEAECITQQYSDESESDSGQ